MASVSSPKPAPPRPNHLAIWGVAIGLTAITIALASRSLHRLDSVGLPAESVQLLHRHPVAILSIEGVFLAGLIGFILYRRRAFLRMPEPTPSDHRDADGHSFVPLSWITRGRIAFGDALFDQDGLYLVAYGDESAAEAAASKMGASGGMSLMGGAALRARHEARQRVVDDGRKALVGRTLADRATARVGSARFARDEVLSLQYGKWLGSKLMTTRGLIIVQDITPDDAAALKVWIASKNSPSDA